MSRPIIILGAGGHAKVLIDTLRLQSVPVLGLSDTDTSRSGQDVLGIRLLGNDDWILSHSPDSVLLVNGIGSIQNMELRKKIFDKFKSKGYSFAVVTHPSSVIASDVLIQEGAQIMAGAVIQPGVSIGANSILNTGALIDHDCTIGAHVHLSPGVVLSGNVEVGSSTHIGTGAKIIQGVKIGKNSLIGAGSVVLKSFPDNFKVWGVPAQPK